MILCGWWPIQSTFHFPIRIIHMNIVSAKTLNTNVSFEKLETISLKERVLRAMEHKILSGELKPGDRLPPEREIAVSMGISRSLVNLCILELETRGFVHIIPRQGTFVTDFRHHGTPQILLSLMNYDVDRLDRGLFDNLVDMRRLLENECVKLAVVRMDDGNLKSLSQALAKMEQFEDTERFILGNFEFHHVLAAASGNAVYAMVINAFRNAMLFFFQVYFTTDERKKASVAQHQELYLALCNRDEAAALSVLKRIHDMGIAGLAEVFKRK